jgi:hypothetical protein
MNFQANDPLIPLRPYFALIFTLDFKDTPESITKGRQRREYP